MLENSLNLARIRFGDLSLIVSIAPNFLDAKIGWIKFYGLWGLSIRYPEIVRQSPCKILHNCKSYRQIAKKFTRPLLKFPQLQKDIFTKQKQMKGWLSDH